MALSHFQTEKERDQREEWKIKWGGKGGAVENSKVEKDGERFIGSVSQRG